jgi:hypothetical protein
MPIIVDTGRQRTVTVSARRVAAIVSGRGRGTTVRDRASVTVVDGSPAVVEVGSPGTQGVPGAAGTDANATFEAISGEAINALRVVKIAAGQAYRADAADPNDAQLLVGISITATSAAGQALTVRNDGPLSDAAWNWAQGVVYCGANGVLTQTPPSTGFVCEVGRVLAPDTILIDIQTPIIRG